MQRLCRSCAIRDHGDADEPLPRIASVGLGVRKIPARHDSQSSLSPQPQSDDLIAPVRGDVEPEEKAAPWSAIAIAACDDLIREIEFLRVEPAVGFDVSLVAISGNGDPLCGDGHLGRRYIA